MKIFTPFETKTFRVAQPVFLGRGSGSGILLIHGFTGSPHDYSFLAPFLAEHGYSVMVPRLPGHGTNAMDFLNTRAEDWIRRALDAAADARGLWKKVGVVGLSMGGLIATILASTIKVDSLVLAAPAFGVANASFNLVPLFRFFVREIPKNPEEIPQFEDPELQTLSREYWSKHMVPALYQLWRVKRIAWKKLKHVVVPTLFIASEKDGTVPLAAVQKAYDNISSQRKEMMVLKKSGHVVVNDVEKELVAERILSWFEKTMGGA
ncbi:MAG: carboxylesterase [Thermotogota bacterium]|nr:carboxylesterase [Thermotogota bacterium]MDK2863853.1 carboxylesterase [Thermotogota bacterium]